MQVILIRHSKTPGNAELRYNGRTDEALSPEGIALAQNMGGDPKVQAVCVTPLQRTQQTAAILFPNARQMVVDDLREMDFGDFEGRSFSEMEHDMAYRAWVEGGCLAPCPNGEGRTDFSERVCAAFEDVVTQAMERGEDQVVFVVHGGTIMAVMERFARPRGDYYSYSVKNCRGYRCQVSCSEAPFILTGLTLWEGTP